MIAPIAPRGMQCTLPSLGRTLAHLGAMLLAVVVGPMILLLLALLSTPAFAQVTGTGTATLTWQPPTQYENGDPLPLSEIERYTIYWGAESGEYTESLDVENGAVQSREIELEVTGPTTFYFAMSAWAHGLESALSNEASKTIALELEDLPPGPPQSVTVELSFSCETTEAGRTCRVVVQ